MGHGLGQAARAGRRRPSGSHRARRAGGAGGVRLSAPADYDVFLSHASEDKLSVAAPLAAELERRGIVVWLDEQQLRLGDSLSERIDEGLARARFGVVVLSHAFFAKGWPRRELDGLVSRETALGQKVILPVWHGLTHEQVVSYSPMLAGKLAVDTAAGIGAVARQIDEALQAGVERASAMRSSPLAVGARGDRDALVLRADTQFQTPMELVRRPSTRIRWKISLQVIYTGQRILSIDDIVPLPPPRTADSGGRECEVQMVRTRNTGYYEAYATFGDIIAAQHSKDDGGLRDSEEWPLILRPGDRLRLQMHHEYELRLDGQAVMFDGDEQLLAYLGPYLDLDRTDEGGYEVGLRMLPTRIVLGEVEWELDVPYAVFVVGVSLTMPELDDEDLFELPRRKRRWPWRS